MKSIYFDGTIHYGIHNNCCYDTRMKTADTIDDLLAWANDNWSHGEIKMEDLDFSDVVIYRKGVDVPDYEEVYDLILLRKMERRS